MILTELKRSVLALAVLSALTGILYPLTVTALARLCLPHQAAGDPGLIGQPFRDPRWFWGRPSATDPPYNASGSAGSNLGPSNPALRQAAQARIRALREADPGNPAPIPADLVTASASGLDPHISPEAAYYQAGRVARLRGIPEDAVRKIIAGLVERPTLGVLGAPRVSVLRLNLALESRRKDLN